MPIVSGSVGHGSSSYWANGDVPMAVPISDFHIQAPVDTILPTTTNEDALSNVQREVIWQQMQGYKREFARAQEQISKLQDKQVDYESHLSTINIYWSTLLQDLTMLMSRVDVSVEAKDLILDDGTNFATFLLNGPSAADQLHDFKELTADALKPALEAHAAYTKDIVVRLFRIMDDWYAKRDTLWSTVKDADPLTKESMVIQTLTDEHNQITALYRKRQTDLDQLQSKCLGFTEQMTRLRSELQVTKIRLEETAEHVDDAKEKLRKVEKSLDREKSALVSAVTSGSVFGENYGAAPTATAVPSGSSVNAVQVKSEVHDASRDELLQYRELAVSRLSELEQLKLERIQQRNTLDQLRIQVNYVPDSMAQDSHIVKSLLSRMQYIQNEAEHYRNEATKLRSDLDELHLTRRDFMDKLESEEKSRRVALEEELKKQENEISGLRYSRDRYQQMYEARCTMDDYEMQQNQEIRKIANTRKDRIATLATDIQRLKTMLAAKTDDKDAFAFYLSGPTDKSYLDHLEEKLKVSEAQIKDLTTELEATKEASSELQSLFGVTVSEYRLKAESIDLTAKLTKLQRLVGPSGEDPVKTLMKTIKTQAERIQQLEQKVQALETVQAPLLSELETVATEWDKLREETSRKVIDLAQKEDLIYKLLSDKTKQESKCSLLIRAKDASANLAAVMKRQSDMQRDRIRSLEEREKNLKMQATKLERAQASWSEIVAIHKNELQEFERQNSSFKEKCSRQQERLAELQGMLRDRTAAYENETHARKRLFEETESMKRKIQEHAKAEASSMQHSDASKQAESYLKLLKCPACDVNFKSHVITRCMHVFCKACLDKLIEIRQRKCPTCRDIFGANDVKEIYL
ncbi:E3 ubiquitin-protein ligase BRE1 [Entomortierella parvispora]|uniref:E3 ubiquitin protein ligase n=1 Tax=Entomortierella parvispora TaxID=205924 RepID=A0A9P3LW06_9FUNG|nr:E3 ubiquitin-protein ligase BRE1 [Entomortierella parvispora]